MVYGPSDLHPLNSVVDHSVALPQIASELFNRMHMMRLT